MIIQGQAYWAKVLGAAKPGYQNQYNEWSIDITVDAKTKKRLLAEGVDASKIKNKGDERGDFLTLKRRELKQDGSPAKPIAVVDHNKNPWPQNQLIGNGSTVNAMIALNEGANGIRPSLIKLQVVSLVEFEGSGDGEDFPAYDESGEEETWSTDDE